MDHYYGGRSFVEVVLAEALVPENFIAEEGWNEHHDVVDERAVRNGVADGQEQAAHVVLFERCEVEYCIRQMYENEA